MLSMRRRGYLPALGSLVTIVVLALAGCGGHGSSKAAADKALNTPQGRQAQTLVKNCVAKEGANGKAIVACIAPKGHTTALKTCVLKAVVYHAGSVAKIENDVTICVLDNR